MEWECGVGLARLQCGLFGWVWVWVLGWVWVGIDVRVSVSFWRYFFAVIFLTIFLDGKREFKKLEKNNWP